MSNQEPNPSSQSPIGEQIPHSGVHGFEKPVREFDKTPLAEAQARGLLSDPTTAEARANLLSDPTTPLAATPSEKKAEKKSFPRWAQYLVGSVVTSAVLGGGTIGYQAKKASDYINELNDADKNPAAGAPAVPGEDVKDTPEYHFTLEPIVLTDAEVATLKAGDNEKSLAIYDAKLVPRIQEVVDQIHENLKNGKPSRTGLDLTNVIQSDHAVSTLTSISGYEEGAQICYTTPNIDGELNFCEADNPSKIELGKPIELGYYELANLQDHHYKTDIKAEITDDNKLILTSND